MKRALLAVALAALAAPASAILQIAGDFGGVSFFCADNQACDTNPLLGQMALANQTVNGVEIQGSSQIQTIGPLNSLNTSSFQVINHNLSDTAITIAISGINFLGPVTSFSASGAGTWQSADSSTINLSYYGDAANQQGADNALDTPGLLLATFNDVAVGAADAFSFNQSGAFAAGPLYSMSLGTSGVLDAWDGLAGTESVLVGRSQTILTTQAIPEPITLALVGMGLVGMGLSRRKQ